MRRPSEESLILGVDPGTRVTGYGLVRVDHTFTAIDFGCIRPPASLPLTQRYRILFEGITQLLERYHPSALAVETQYIDKNVQSGIKLGMARGVIILAATLQEIPVFEYAPTRAKRAVSGRGNASKAQVQGMIQCLLSLAALPEPEDAADALALAICHAHVSKIGEHEAYLV